ncbi:hypothetical protein J5N97_002435 [Dioscorea zingiberensis]|uniref:Uncharacterized protein n=1 Tax=Dioscorea zingiberensis TaxID=325984 RepID=A0A9D5HPD1_9LILI|nr:hypothetical protein J5N97_002435 [Dioscorea zingiberensis]
MVPPRKGLNDADEGSDRADRPLGVDSSEESREMGGSRGRALSASLAERVRDSLRNDGDADLLLDRGDVENGVLQWLRALDSQVLGACRADERLKPMLKLNVSSGVAEYQLMTQLSQHFEASEIGMLARCLCVPLVSIRVGKIIKQGGRLCPTSIRGHLNLTLLPSSNMCISFFGDDGSIKKLAVVSSISESPAVAIEEISADSSGRSFLVNLPGSGPLYFWCSEKSKSEGMRLLTKMKDLLLRRPSLAHLSGVSESRLASFATHLQAYFHGSTGIAKAANLAASSPSLVMSASGAHDSDCGSQPSATGPKSSCHRLGVSHTTKVHPFPQGSLSPKSNTFKDAPPRSSAFIRSGVRDKVRRRGGGNSSYLPGNVRLVTSDSPTSNTSDSLPASDHFEDEKLSELFESVKCCISSIPCPSLPLASLSPVSVQLPLSRDVLPSGQFSPYYCWCPPCITPVRSTFTTTCLPSSTLESQPLPPFPSVLLAVETPALIPSRPPIGVTELPTMGPPNLFHEPLFPLSFPAPALVTSPLSQQIPTFTPLISDPIVHIPIIDICSSGQAYLVSAGPAISSAIPPLLPNVANPIILNSESALEKSARETLRVLMASTPITSGPHLMRVLPAVFGKENEKFTFIHVNNQAELPTDCEVIIKAIPSAESSLSVKTVAEGATADTDEPDRDTEYHPEAPLLLNFSKLSSFGVCYLLQRILYSSWAVAIVLIPCKKERSLL